MAGILVPSSLEYCKAWRTSTKDLWAGRVKGVRQIVPEDDDQGSMLLGISEAYHTHGASYM
jgi:hypothetical protein